MIWRKRARTLCLTLLLAGCGESSPSDGSGGNGGNGGGVGGAGAGAGGAGGGLECPEGSHEGTNGSCEATLGAFAETSPIAAARDHHVTWGVHRPGGRFVFVAGGALDMMTPTPSIERAEVLADGSLAAWETLVPTLPSIGPMIVASDRRIVTAGGIRAGGNSKTSETALIDDEGGLGAFEPGPSLQVARFHGAAVHHGGWAYATGGLDGTGTSLASIERVAFDDDGPKGSWILESEEMPEPRSHHGLALYGGALYVTGGLTRVNNQFDQDVLYDTIVRSVIQADGSLGAWSVAGTLPKPLVVHASFVHLDQLYLVGGLSMGLPAFQTSLWRAPLRDDGTIGPWEELTAALPIARGHCHQTPLLGGFLYSIGGTNTFGSQTNAFFAKFE